MSSEGELICGYEEHTHLLECYADTYADIENEDVWGTTVPLLSGDRNADVVAVAESQIGYRESDRNYLVFDENDTPGYDVFGENVSADGEIRFLRSRRLQGRKCGQVPVFKAPVKS